MREQIANLANIIDSDKALNLWDKACATKWNKIPVWVHGDFATGNILMQDGKLSAVIDFGGTAIGDPACDLVITWKFFEGKSREIFMNEMALDENTWLRVKARTLWKTTFELCQLDDKNSSEAELQKRIIDEVMNAK